MRVIAKLLFIIFYSFFTSIGVSQELSEAEALSLQCYASASKLSKC